MSQPRICSDTPKGRQPEKRIDYLKKALAMNSKDAHVRRMLGDAYLRPACWMKAWPSTEST
jgi:uncharacterized protein HemY